MARRCIAVTNFSKDRRFDDQGNQRRGALDIAERVLAFRSRQNFIAMKKDDRCEIMGQPTSWSGKFAYGQGKRGVRLPAYRKGWAALTHLETALVYASPDCRRWDAAVNTVRAG